MNNRIYLIIILIGTLVLVQCRKDEIVTESDPTPVEADATNVSFLLHITDEAGTAIEEATITVASTSESLTSDENGVVLFDMPSVAFEGERITIEHPAYNTLTKMVTGVMNSHTRVDIVLTATVTKLISTGETGSIGEGELTLPTSLLSTGGSSYTGPVAVKYTYLDPDDRDFLNAAPGNLLALNTANQYRQLASLGMYSIELYDEQGGELTIPEGSEATVKFPIAESNAGTFPDEVPLWYFDEEKGLWIEEGKAIVEGNMMVAQVSHFTWWNCDLPYEFVPLCMSFVDEDGNPVSGIEISFSVNGFKYGLETTGTDGNILTKTPIGEIITISYYLKGELVDTQEVGPFEEGSRKPVIVLSIDISVVSGTALDCDMNPVSSGYGITFLNGATKIFPIVDGAFSFSTTLVGGYEVTLYDVSSGKVQTVTATVVEVGTDVMLGSVVVCDLTITTGIRGTIMIDTDGDGVVDAPALGRSILVGGDAELSVGIAVDGSYEILLPPGNYMLLLAFDPSSTEELTEYGTDNIDDGDPTDGLKGNIIKCTIEANEIDDGNDFLILPPSTATVTGTVFMDTDGDSIGDEPIEGATVWLISYGGNVQQGTATEADGSFSYTLENTVIDAYLITLAAGDAVSDYDATPDPDGDDSAEGPNERVPLGISFNEVDSDNNFVLRPIVPSTVSGSVLVDTNDDGIGDEPAVGIPVYIDAILAEFPQAAWTDENGKYEFDNLLAPYDYEVSIDTAGYTLVRDYDESPDPDGDDSADGANNLILVNLTVGEADLDNNFVVRRE